MNGKQTKAQIMAEHEFMLNKKIIDSIDNRSQVDGGSPIIPKKPF
jgi:hypothetical protein